MEFAQGPRPTSCKEGPENEAADGAQATAGRFFSGLNLLFQAVANNDAKKVNELLDAGVFADEARTDGCNAFLTPLHVAATVGNADIVASLIDRGKAWVNMLDRDGRSPAHRRDCTLSRVRRVKFDNLKAQSICSLKKGRTLMLRRSHVS